MAEDQINKSGHRSLTEEEMSLLIQIKKFEAKFNGMIDTLRALPDIDQRNVALAQTYGEDAFMRAVRAVTRPARISE